MKTLFLLNSHDNKYSKYLNLVYKLFADQDSIKEEKFRSKSFLTQYDVVVFNEITASTFNFLNKKKIIKICINDAKRFHENIDIFIDPFLKKKTFKSKTLIDLNLIEVPNSAESLANLINVVSHLKWDSSFWGFKVGYLDVKRLTKNIIYRFKKYIKKKSFKHIQFLCNCHDPLSVEIAEKNNFCFKDIRLTFEKEIQGAPKKIINKNFIFSIAKQNEYKKIKNLITDLYLSSRYYFDKKFNKKKIILFYSNWLLKSIKGTFDNLCYVLKKKNTIVGFCTVKFSSDKKNECSIGLFGVNKSLRGKNYSHQILKLVENELKIKKIKKINVITQGRNYSAVRSYEGYGFKLKKTELWYHKWL